MSTEDIPPKKTVSRHIFEDLIRVVPLFIIGILLIKFSPDFAQWINEPPYAAWGLVVGGIFNIIGFSHIARRLIFPSMDMPKIGGIAITNPIGAGLVFFGTCYLLGQIVNIMGTAIQLPFGK